MQNYIQNAAARVCSCDHKTPRTFTFTSPEFIKTTSARLQTQGLSATETIDWTLEELFDHHSGRLNGPDGKPVVFDTDDPDEVEKFDDAFRNDSRRFINRIKAKAQEDWTGKYRLQKRMIYPMVLLWFALQIHDCRSSGKCSRTADHT